MPTYQYACTTADCGNRFELVQSFTDPAASECPVCQGPVRKVYGSVGVVFKGSGFYRTDSRSASTASEAGSSKSEAKSDAKSESKPAAKTDSSTSTSSASSSSSGSKAAAAS